MSRVCLALNHSRTDGLRKVMAGLGTEPMAGRDVLIKPNFNTADPCPGSTDNETLSALIDLIWEQGAKSVSLGERSYPPTREVMRDKGILELLREKGVTVIDFDELPNRDWVEFRPAGSHWPKGFRVARPVVEADYLVEACCLKTHRYGGIFTMSLKLAVGTVPTTRNGYNYMGQLHSSPYQRLMIAEINQAFRPKLIVLDGVEAFVDGGPMTGARKRLGATLASADRVALDAVGVALLKDAGSNRAIMGPKIFDQEQIARAAELGLGVSTADEIELVSADPASRPYAGRIGAVLSQG